MPLRGSLFRKISKIRSERKVAEQTKFKRDVKREAMALKLLRTQRVQTEGRSALLSAIEAEKARIRAAKAPSRFGAIERLVAKGTSAAGRAAEKEFKRRAARVKAGKPVFGTLSQELSGKGKRRKKKRKTSTKKRRKRS